MYCVLFERNIVKKLELVPIIREIDMMLIGQLIEILKQYDSDREVMIHTLKGENVEVNGYFIPKNLDESIFYLTDLDVIPRN